MPKSLKPLYAALLTAAAVGLPNAANAGNYYYSMFNVTNFTVEGQYKKLAGDGSDPNNFTLVWARPASDDAPPHQATFTSSASAIYTPGNPPNPANSVSSNPATVSKTITTHVPPLGFFPVSSEEAYIDISSSTNPGQDVFTQSNGYSNGNFPSLSSTSFVRSDSAVNNLGAAVNPFGVAQSAGEVFTGVTEGSLWSHGQITSTTAASFSGWMDFSDKTFDSSSLPPGAPGGPPVPGDPTTPDSPYNGYNNGGWTGLFRVVFDYNGQIQLRTDDPEDFATGQYSFGVDFFNNAGDPVNINGTDAKVSITRSLTRNAGGDINNIQTTTHFEQQWDFSQDPSVWNPAGPPNPPVIRAQITIGEQIFGTARDFTVPEPASIFLMGAGLMGFKRFGSRKKA